MTFEPPKVPRAFFWRRMHSLTGLWLVIFLIEHLLTNSQAALFFGDDGAGFVRAVNMIKNLPYLPVIEITLLGVPIFIHMIWGIEYLRTGLSNSSRSDETTPSLPQYPRNKAYTWQRITSWVLVLTLIGHIVHMRFIEYPNSADKDGHHYYMVKLSLDQGLYTLADRLGVQLYDQNKIEVEKKLLQEIEITNGIQKLLMEQKKEQQKEWIEALESRSFDEGQVIAIASDFGTAELLMVRESFKMPVMIVLYTIFVLAAVYHGFNGLWTFMITWGVTLTQASQRLMRRISILLIVLIGFLGLAAIWGTYWINLRY